MKEIFTERKLTRHIDRLFDNAICLVMNRPGAILSISDNNQDEFFKELSLLNNPREWTDFERNVRFCPARI